MQDIEIFVQAEGRPTISLIQGKQDAATAALAAAAIVHFVSLEEADEPLTAGVTLTTAGTGHRSRVHLRGADGSILQMEVECQVFSIPSAMTSTGRLSSTMSATSGR
jgi:hypothetical protein